VPGAAAGLETEVDAVTVRATAVAAAEQHIILRRRSSAVAGRMRGVWPVPGPVSSLDAAAALVRTLRCGLPAELVWPEYHTAVAELEQEGIRIERQWLLPAVHDAETVFVCLRPRARTAACAGAPEASPVRSGQFWLETIRLCVVHGASGPASATPRAGARPRPV
jgi:hypothetical protein